MANGLGTKPLQIDELLRIVSQFQQQPQAQVAAAGNAVKTGFENLPQAPEQQQAEELGPLRQILVGLASAFSNRAATQNPFSPPGESDFLGDFNRTAQEQADRANAASRLKFEDERGTALARLQDLIGQRGEAQSQANLQQARIDRSSEREQDRGARVQEQEAARKAQIADREDQQRFRLKLEKQTASLRADINAKEVDRKIAGQAALGANRIVKGGRRPDDFGGEDIVTRPMAERMLEAMSSGEDFEILYNELLDEYEFELSTLAPNDATRAVAIADFNNKYRRELQRAAEEHNSRLAGEKKKSREDESDAQEQQRLRRQFAEQEAAQERFATARR